MAWVRIHDGAMTNPKIAELSDKAFRLWVWGLSYAQQHLTDGVLAPAALGTMPVRLSRAVSDLAAKGLWESAANGFIIHDYLDWNDSRDAVLKKRSEAKERMSSARERRSQNVLSRTSKRTSGEEVLRGLGNKKQDQEKETSDDLHERAGRLREELYPAWYAKHRHGARLRLVANQLEFQEALSLVGIWTDEQLEKLAGIFLTTDDEWISRTDRSFKLFASKASWCDDRLKQWEAEQRRHA